MRKYRIVGSYLGVFTGKYGLNEPQGRRYPCARRGKQSKKNDEHYMHVLVSERIFRSFTKEPAVG